MIHTYTILTNDGVDSDREFCSQHQDTAPEEDEQQPL